MEWLIVFGCFYFAYTSVRQLMALPFAEWQLVQWLLVAISAALAAAGVLYAIRAVKSEKRKIAERKAAVAEQEAAQATPSPEQEEDLEG